MRVQEHTISAVVRDFVEYAIDASAQAQDPDRLRANLVEWIRAAGAERLQNATQSQRHELYVLCAAAADALYAGVNVGHSEVLFSVAVDVDEEVRSRARDLADALWTSDDEQTRALRWVLALLPGRVRGLDTQRREASITSITSPRNGALTGRPGFAPAGRRTELPGVRMALAAATLTLVLAVAASSLGWFEIRSELAGVLVPLPSEPTDGQR